MQVSYEKYSLKSEINYLKNKIEKFEAFNEWAQIEDLFMVWHRDDKCARNIGITLENAKRRVEREKKETSQS